jgi:ketosteroid isomerase-like protein
MRVPSQGTPSPRNAWPARSRCFSIARKCRAEKHRPRIMTNDAAERIAAEFIGRYEAAWAQGAEAAAKLYTADSVLVGYITAIGRPEILKLLRRIIAQGWTQIRIKAVNVRQIGDVILLACGSDQAPMPEKHWTQRRATCSSLPTARGYQHCTRRDEFSDCRP